MLARIKFKILKKDPSREATCSESQSSSKVTVEIDKNELEIMKEELDKLRNFENHVQTVSFIIFFTQKFF